MLQAPIRVFPRSRVHRRSPPLRRATPPPAPYVVPPLHRWPASYLTKADPLRHPCTSTLHCPLLSDLAPLLRRDLHPAPLEPLRCRTSPEPAPCASPAPPPCAAPCSVTRHRDLHPPPPEPLRCPLHPPLRPPESLPRRPLSASLFRFPRCSRRQ